MASTAALIPLITGAIAVDKPSVMSETIRVNEVKAAQDTWCEALITISKTHAEAGLAKSKPLAGDVIDAAYGYQFGPVAFKPTWAKGTSPSATPAVVLSRISSGTIPPLATPALPLEPREPIGAPG